MTETDFSEIVAAMRKEHEDLRAKVSALEVSLARREVEIARLRVDQATLAVQKAVNLPRWPSRLGTTDSDSGPPDEVAPPRRRDVN
jgi:hypothetical protein